MNDTFLEFGIVGAILLLSLYANYRQYDDNQRLQKEIRQQIMDIIEAINMQQSAQNALLQRLLDAFNFQKLLDKVDEDH